MEKLPCTLQYVWLQIMKENNSNISKRSTIFSCNENACDSVPESLFCSFSFELKFSYSYDVKAVCYIYHNNLTLWQLGWAALSSWRLTMHPLKSFQVADSCTGQLCTLHSFRVVNPAAVYWSYTLLCRWMNIHSLELFNPLYSCVGQPCPLGWMNLHSLELLNPLDSCVGQPCPAGWMNILSLELFHPLDSFVWQPCSAGWMNLHSWTV